LEFFPCDTFHEIVLATRRLVPPTSLRRSRLLGVLLLAQVLDGRTRAEHDFCCDFWPLHHRCAVAGAVGRGAAADDGTAAVHVHRTRCVSVVVIAVVVARGHVVRVAHEVVVQVAIAVAVLALIRHLRSTG
jgi:hypothetical protein